MLLTGEEFLQSIRDGRRVYVGGERVDDVTVHPAFRNAARSFAMIYDRKRAPENREVMTVEEDGDIFSTYFLLPRSREDLQRRYETHRRIASWTYGLMGRAPDNFPSYVSGLVMYAPPFGLNLFASQAVFQTPLGNIYRGVLPFLAINFATLMVITYVPSISMVELTAAVVRYIDHVDAVFDAQLGVLRGGDALDDQRQLVAFLDLVDLFPVERLLMV